MARSELPDGWPEMAPSYPSANEAYDAWRRAIDDRYRRLAKAHGISTSLVKTLLGVSASTDGLAGPPAGLFCGSSRPLRPHGYRAARTAGLVGEPALVRVGVGWVRLQTPWTEKGAAIYRELTADLDKCPHHTVYLARVEVSDGEE